MLRSGGVFPFPSVLSLPTLRVLFRVSGLLSFLRFDLPAVVVGVVVGVVVVGEQLQ